MLFWPTVLAVLVLSLIPPGPRLPDTGWDKSNHLLAFAVLAVLGLRSYPGSKGVLLVGLLAYGGVIEGLQSLAPDRFAEWADLLANALGLLFGWGLGWHGGLPEGSGGREGHN
ncbi:MAG: VanZ family protein [Candidatus Accumulibacter sp.]|uniref:VanZ family protein n=1 Tax=Candidatus Accumulibacter proximus TaxID=2954385 RepID=A0A935UG35_9PROT|nr:VanZ family protein [Candidatus Accumulibacter proximus]